MLGWPPMPKILETVQRLTHPVRDARASYEVTLDVLKFAESYAPQTVTKTSLMLGLGETDEEVVQALTDIRAANVDVVTFGQYMRPRQTTCRCSALSPPRSSCATATSAWRWAFLEVVSGPLVRSSYRAERVLEHNNAGLDLNVLQGLRDSATSAMRC